MADDIFKDAMEQFELTQNLDRDQRELAIEDMLFIHAEDGQWDTDIIDKRGDRPRYTIDRISGAIDQVIGNQRQTRSGPKVTPQKDGDDKGALTRKGLIRSIEEISNADNIYDNAFMEQLVSGYGGWRIYTEEEDEESFTGNQVIRMSAIRSAASSLYFDPDAEEYAKSDAMWGFLVWFSTDEAFKKAFPKATQSDFGSDIYKSQNRRDWFSDNGLRIAEYWKKTEIDKKLLEMSDGRILYEKEEEDVLDELLEMGITVAREKMVKGFKVERYLLNGAEILQGPELWAGKYIPLVPVYGKTAVVQNEHFIRGLVRKAKDAQRILNYATSSAIEASSLTPKDPYFGTPKQVKNHTKQWGTFNTKNPPIMLYDPDPDAPGPPTRTGAPSVQSALIQQIQQAQQDLHATTGIEPASLGNVPELKSGKAIQAQQAMGDRGTYVYQSNFEKSMIHGYEIIGDLLPRIMDTQRTEKIIGADDQIEEITINERKTTDLNQPIIDEETGREVIVNDLSVGNYSYGVSTGPAAHTKREETVDQLISIAQDDPDFKARNMDLILDNMDLNMKEEIKARQRKWMIQNKLVEPTEDEAEEMGLNKPQPPDPTQVALVKNLEEQTTKLQIDQELVMAKVENTEAATEKLIMETQKTAVDAFTAAVQSMLDKMAAGLPLDEEDNDLVAGQQALVEETQEDVLEGQEIARSLPMNAKGMEIPAQNPNDGQPIEPQQGNVPGVVIPGPLEV